MKSIRLMSDWVFSWLRAPLVKHAHGLTSRDTAMVAGLKSKELHTSIHGGRSHSHKSHASPKILENKEKSLKRLLAAQNQADSLQSCNYFYMLT
jgi:hypothetical protein